MADHFVVYLQQPDRSAAVHRVSSRYIVSQLLFPLNYSYSWICHTVDMSPYSRMERRSKRIPSKSMSFSQSKEAAIPVSSLGSNKR